MGSEYDVFGCLPLWVWAIIIVIMVAAITIKKAIETSQRQSTEPTTRRESLQERTDRVKCPFCGEFVMPDAIVCRFCRQSLTTGELLKQGMAAAKAGDKVKARRLLARVVHQDKYNETGWLWLAGAVESDDERRAYLEKVLEINPDNQLARKGIETLSSNNKV